MSTQQAPTKIVPIRLSENESLNQTYFSSVYNQRKWSGIYNWGPDNLMPEKLRELTTQSPTHAALIDLKQFMLDNYQIEDPLEELPIITEYNPVTLEQWISNTIRDYVIYSQFFCQLTPTYGEKLLFNYLPVKNCRFSSEINAEGEIDRVVISKDWSNTRIRENRKWTLPLYRKGRVEEPTVWLYRDNIYEDVYQTPSYFSAVDSILTEISINKWNLENIRNGWAPRLAITMHGMYSNEELAQLAHDLNAQYSGIHNTGKVVFMHTENPDMAPKIDKIDLSLNDSSYLNLVTSVKDYILSAHKCTSPALAGLAINGGFEGQGTALLTAYQMYDQIVVNSMRSHIETELNRILETAGYSIRVRFFLKALQITGTETNQ